MTISLVRAKKLIEELRDRDIYYGRDPATWCFYERHIYGTAEIAKMIASEIKNMDPNKVFFMGLLHDISRTEENRLQRFHGILGYEVLINEDKDAARSSLLHMFPWNKLPPYSECKKSFFNIKKDYDFIDDFIKNNPATDEDYLIQLCDNLANKNGFVTLEERAKEYIIRHGNVSVDDILIHGKELKDYFEAKIGHDIYDFYKNKI